MTRAVRAQAEVALAVCTLTPQTLFGLFMPFCPRPCPDWDKALFFCDHSPHSEQLTLGIVNSITHLLTSVRKFASIISGSREGKWAFSAEVLSPLTSRKDMYSAKCRAGANLLRRGLSRAKRTNSYEQRSVSSERCPPAGLSLRRPLP